MTNTVQRQRLNHINLSTNWLIRHSIRRNPEPYIVVHEKDAIKSTLADQRERWLIALKNIVLKLNE